MPLASDLSRLANEQDAITVRNTQRGIVVFMEEQTKVSAEWTAADDFNGGDVLEVPSSFLKSPRFREAILRGILTIEDAPEVLDNAIRAQKAEWDSRQQAKADSAITLSRAADKTIAHGQTCIAPKGGNLCGNISLVMGANPAEKPPLCAEHAHLLAQYVPVETGRVIPRTNKSEVVWKRVGAPDRVSS